MQFQRNMWAEKLWEEFKNAVKFLGNHTAKYCQVKYVS